MSWFLPTARTRRSSECAVNQLSVIGAPKSSHSATCFSADALSTASPRLPRTPACTQVARWWPRESSGRPHRQFRTERGKGRCNRLWRSTRNNCGSNLVAQLDGTAENAPLDPEPLCARTRAFTGSLNHGKRTRSLWRCSTREAASCQPNCPSSLVVWVSAVPSTLVHLRFGPVGLTRCT